ncbi:MAG TPA: hypothetical protein VFI25_08815 [Planctomycetota bacterium]|jgi:hypothetical protein|nr:hypothetical protein [Planctomycetota bacterium]
MSGLAIVAFAAGGLQLAPLDPLPPRPDRWYPLVASSGEGIADPISFTTDSSSVRWTARPDGGSRVEGAVLPRRGDAAAYALRGDETAASLSLPPAPGRPVALGVGISDGERGELEAGGWLVLSFEGTSELDPFRLDGADLVVFGERLDRSRAAGIEVCLRAGLPVAVGERTARTLFGDRPPPGIRPVGGEARQKAPPLRIRAGALAPSTLAFCGLSGAAGALLLGPVALALLSLLLRGRAGGRTTAMLLAGGGAAISVLAGAVPLPRPSEVRLVLLDLGSGGARLERIVFGDGNQSLTLPPSAVAWPGGESDRLSVERGAGGTSVRIHGAARIAGGEPAGLRVLASEGGSGVRPLDPLGPACLLRDGRLAGAVRPPAVGEPILLSGERGNSVPSRRLRALLDVIEPPRGELFLAEIPPPAGGATTFLLARAGGD